MNNSIATGFVSLANIVSEVLLAIDDMEQKRYQAIALQRVLNVIRNVNVNMSSLYDEEAITLDTDLRTGAYPVGLIKALSVGIYKNGVWWGFTKVPDMAKTMTSDTEGYDTTIGEGEDIPSKGVGFGARGKNFGYWTPDDKNCRFIVRNYVGDKVILRYRSNGIKCTGDTCIPYDAKDLIVNMVVYQFAMSGKPRRYTGAELQALKEERARFYDEFTDIHYLPHNLGEWKDMEYASLNTVPRRS
jgi:hypothetical protein